MIIVIANSKGGVGKSTLAVHLAAWLHEQGARSFSPIATLSTPHPTGFAKPFRLCELSALVSTDEILNELPDLKQEAEYVVADGPGSNIDISRTLLLCADIAIVPCKASMLEVRCA